MSDTTETISSCDDAQPKTKKTETRKRSNTVVYKKVQPEPQPERNRPRRNRHQHKDEPKKGKKRSEMTPEQKNALVERLKQGKLKKQLLQQAEKNRQEMTAKRNRSKKLHLNN